MKGKILLLITFTTSLYFLSCQKELGVPAKPVEPPIGKLLVKLTAISGDTTIVTDYFYDDSDRITSLQITGIYGKNKTTHFKRYYRDNGGRITNIAEIVSHNSSASDTLYTSVYYPDAFTAHFSYTTSNYGIMGTSVKDSTVFTYSAEWVVSSFSYLISSLETKTTPNSKIEYKYDNNGNLVEQKSFIYTSGLFTLVSLYKFSYDNSINPLPVGREFILVKVDGNGSKNNIKSIEMTDAGSNAVITRTYSLNKANKPDKCYEKLASDSSFTYSYLYR